MSPVAQFRDLTVENEHLEAICGVSEGFCWKLSNAFDGRAVWMFDTEDPSLRDSSGSEKGLFKATDFGHTNFMENAQFQTKV